MKRRLLILACLTLVTPLLAAAVPAAASSAPSARTIVLVRHGYYAPDPAADERLGPHLAPIGVA